MPELRWGAQVAPALVALALAACGESPVIPSSVFAVTAYAGRPLPLLEVAAPTDSVWLVSSELSVFTDRATWRHDYQHHQAGQVRDSASSAEWDYSARGDSVFLRPHCVGTQATCGLGYVGSTDGVALSLVPDVTPRLGPVWQFIRTGPLPR